MSHLSLLVRIVLGHFLPLIALLSLWRPAAAQEPPALPVPAAAGHVDAAQPSLPDVVAVSAGGFHTCALTNGGSAGSAAVCWGRDDHGQLGDGPLLENQIIPVEVVGLPAGVKAIAAGTLHTCALTTQGAVLCWGADDLGQLGDGGSRQDKPVPASVVGLPLGVLAVTAGNHHTCALTAAGGVRCWGDDTYGQLGNGPAGSQDLPMDVVGLSSGVEAISAGALHSCALLASGAVQCWGDNREGKLGGAGANPQEPAPQAVLGLPSAAIAVASGFSHTCALTNTGGVFCWGNGDYGQLGGSTSSLDKLTRAPAIGMGSGAVLLTSGFNHACAASSDGKTRCWGDNWYGQIGINKLETLESKPEVVEDLDGSALVISGGRQHTCALTDADKLMCWGDDSYGQLGDGGANVEKPVPVEVRAPIPRLHLPIIMRPQ